MVFRGYYRKSIAKSRELSNEKLTKRSLTQQLTNTQSYCVSVLQEKFYKIILVRCNVYHRWPGDFVYMR